MGHIAFDGDGFKPFLVQGPEVVSRSHTDIDQVSPSVSSPRNSQKQSITQVIRRRDTRTGLLCRAADDLTPTAVVMDPEADQHDELGPPELGSEAEERLRSSIARAEGRRSRKDTLNAWLCSSSRSSITAEQQQTAQLAAKTAGCCQVSSTKHTNCIELRGLPSVYAGSRGDIKRVKSQTKVSSR